MLLYKLKLFKQKLDTSTENDQAKLIEKYSQLLERTFDMCAKAPTPENLSFMSELIETHKRKVDTILDEKLDKGYFKNSKLLKEKKKMIRQKYLNDLYDYKLAEITPNISPEKLSEKKIKSRKSKVALIKHNVFKVSSVLVSVVGICLGGVIASVCSTTFCGFPIIASSVAPIVKSGIRFATNGGKKVINGMNDDLANSLTSCFACQANQNKLTAALGGM